MRKSRNALPFGCLYAMLCRFRRGLTQLWQYPVRAPIV